MARLVGEYRGYQLWRTWQTRTYTKTDGTTSKSNTACYHAIHKEGKYPPIRPKSGECMRKYLIEKRIDEALEQPPADEVFEVPADVPREVDTYNGVPIYYHPKRNQYHATVEGHGKYCNDLDEAHAFIDHEQYINSPQYIQAKADEKAEQDAALERARIYGIGTDEQGDPIPPTEEEIAARETFYAKEHLARGTTIREEYEEERGVTPSEAEIELREEARQEEAKAQGDVITLYWLKLQAEIRKLMEMFT